MAYLGKSPVVGNFQVCDAITVVNGQAGYTLQVGGSNVSPESANHMLVSLNGILQAPTSSFSVSGATLTFVSNLATGDVIDFVMLLGNVLDIGTPSDGTVTNAKLAQDIISGETELAVAPASTDEFLVSDAGTLKRVDASLVGRGKIGQVVSTTKTDTFSSASATWTDLTGMSVAITPSATTSKILILVNLGSFVTDNGNKRAQGLLLRGTTSIAEGDSATGEECTFAFCGRTSDGAYHQFSASASFLDSPSSTSETTYKLQVQRGPDAAGTVYVNRPGTLDANGGNTVSTITVMEVLA